jgi:serine protease
MKIKPKRLRLTALALGIASVSAVSIAQLSPLVKKFQTTQLTAFAGPLQTDRQFDRLIIKFKEKSTTTAGTFDFNMVSNQVSLLDKDRALDLASTGVSGLSYLKSVTEQTHVVVTAQKLNRAELFVLAKKIEQDPRVAYAEIDEILQTQFVPNDPFYQNLQWHYQAARTYPGGANLPAAWDKATGSGVVVAVIDTGVRPHADLVANLLPGYDFISADTSGTFVSANDGDGRDPDPSDPGDFGAANACGKNELVHNSSWHGTHVAGTIAAVTNNGVGVAGVAFGAKVLPVRVIGVCGGFISDVAAGMQWAAGLTVPGVPANANKAKVLNMSLGGPGACSTTLQDTVNSIRAVGSVVVAATGNDTAQSIGQPANCTGVIAVTAHTKTGDNANYANIGSGTVISGPGGGTGTMVPGDGSAVYSTLNAGTTLPGADNYGSKIGTSMATPHVAGVAALIASVQPSITPDALQSVLVSSARPHPTGTFCATRAGCGAGLLDAEAALNKLSSLAPSVAASVTPPGVLPTGSIVTFTAAASPSSSGNATFSYQWTQLAGPTVTLASTTAASTSFTAPVPGANYTFAVKVTDSSSLTASNQVSVTTNTAPVLLPIASQSIVQGGNLSFVVSAADAETNPVVFVATGLPAGSTLEPATGIFNWNAAGPLGTYVITVTPNDGIVNGASQSVVITVTAPPTVTAPVGTGSGGGGGAMGVWDLVMLLALGAAALVTRQRQVSKH